MSRPMKLTAPIEASRPIPCTPMTFRSYLKTRQKPVPSYGYPDPDQTCYSRPRRESLTR